MTVVHLAVEDQAGIGLEAVQQLQAALLAARLPDPAAQEFFRACVAVHLGPGLKPARRSKGVAHTLSLQGQPGRQGAPLALGPRV